MQQEQPTYAFVNFSFSLFHANCFRIAMNKFPQGMWGEYILQKALDIHLFWWINMRVGNSIKKLKC